MSTYSDALAAYHANAGYAENDSAIEAAAFATACRQLAATPSETEHGGERLRIDPRVFLDQAREADQFARLRGGSCVRFVSFEDSRA